MGTNVRFLFTGRSRKSQGSLKLENDKKDEVIIHKHCTISTMVIFKLFNKCVLNMLRIYFEC